MDIKFNFYDIYGFALPGFSLLAILWLPFGLIEKNWPDAQFSSALVAVILAYFAGHVLQTIAQKAIPSTLPNGRYPSSVFLDEKDETFSEEFKYRLAEQIRTTFDLDISPRESIKQTDRVRRDAFFLCRSALIKSKTILYAEQFEGLYALMRGLSASFAVGVVYYLGWAYSSLWSSPWSGPIMLAGIIVTVAAMMRLSRNKHSKPAKIVMTASVLLAAFATGHYLGLSRVATIDHRGQLIAAATLSFLASERCYAGYKSFAEEFAKAVYRDFSNYEKPRGENGAKGNNDKIVNS